MKYLLLYFVLLCPFAASLAQDKIHRLGKPFEYRDSTKVGNGRIEVIYRHHYSVSTEEIDLWSDLRMQLFDKGSYQINLHAHYCNISFTAHSQSGWRSYDAEAIDRFGNVNPTYFCSILSDDDRGAMEVTVSDYLLSRTSAPWQYTEPIPTLEWTLLPEENRQVAGYACFGAVTEFRGRTWKAWYTPKLPFRAGPWKLSGLPGLILHAEDTEGCYSFSAIEIRSETEAVYQYNPISSKGITREKYLRYERNYHAAPQSIMAGGAEVFTLHKEGATEVDLTFTVPYHPIELE